MTTSIKGTIKKRGDNGGSCLDFKANKTTVHYNEDVTFIPTGGFLGKGEPTFLWDFGDDTTSTDREPVHAYQPEDIVLGLISSTLRVRQRTSKWDDGGYGVMEADTTNGTSNGAYGCFAQSDGEGTGRNVYPPYDTFWYARRGDMWGMYTITIECPADSEMLMFGSLTLNFPTYFRVIIGNGYNPPTSYPTTYTLASDNRTNYGFNRTTLTFIKGDGTTIVQYPGTNPWGGWTSNANNTITLPSGGIKKIIAYAPILWARIDATYLADIYYYPVTYDVTPLIISPMDVSLKVSKENEFRTLVKKGYITIT